MTAVGAPEYSTPIASETGKYPAEFVHFAVLRSPTRFLEATTEEQYLNNLEILECSLGLTAYNYSNVRASGSQLNVSTKRIPLQPAKYNSDIWANGTLVFEQDGLPALKVKPIDILALIQLFKSPRFSGGYQIGESPEIVQTGIGVALATGSVLSAFENMAATMTEQIRSNSNETIQGLLVVPKIFVRVRWVWLALPAILSIATVVLLLVSILNS